MRTLLNGPLEIGLRVLVILDAQFPRAVNFDDLLVIDHVSLHSDDFDGPESLHPSLPLRSADVGARRDGIRQGVEMLIHRGLALPALEEEGILIVASEQSHSIVELIESPYLRLYRDRVIWALESDFANSTAGTRETLSGIVRSWPETVSEETS